MDQSNTAQANSKLKKQTAKDSKGAAANKTHAGSCGKSQAAFTQANTKTTNADSKGLGGKE